MQALKSRKMKFDLLEHDAPLPHADTVWIATEFEILGHEQEGYPVSAGLDDIEGAIERVLTGYLSEGGQEIVNRFNDIRGRVRYHG